MRNNGSLGEPRVKIAGSGSGGYGDDNDDDGKDDDQDDGQAKIKNTCRIVDGKAG